MKFGLLFLTILISISLTIAQNTTNTIGDCEYDENYGLLTFICFENDLKMDFFQIDETLLECRNSDIFLRDAIQSIKFSACKLITMYPGMFASYRNVIEIDISEMSLNEWRPEWFHHLNYLKKIVAANNSIKGPLYFYGLEYLEYLDLSSNPIGDITIDTFHWLFNLKYLNMANTNLTKILPRMFGYHTQLMVVNLAKNKLTEFDLKIFLPSFSTLIAVNLNQNRLMDLGFATRMHFPKLKLMSVVSNELSCEYLEYYLYEGGWSGLRISSEINSLDISVINNHGHAVCT